MKKLVYSAAFLLFVACSANDKKENTKTENEAKNEVVAAKKFACPMQCEGSKTYAAAGKCPVCKMDLQEIAMAEGDSTNHKH